MAKKTTKNTSSISQIGRIGLTIYQKNGDYKHQIVTNTEYLNLTIGCCEELLFHKFRNIVIDFTFEHLRFIQFAPIEKAKQQKQFYLVCTRSNNQIEALQTDLVSEVILLINAIDDNKSRLYKRIEIVNKSH